MVLTIEPGVYFIDAVSNSSWAIGHFRVAFCLCFKTSHGAKPFMKMRQKTTRKWSIPSAVFPSLPKAPLANGDASCQLVSTCDSVWPGLARACVDLRSLWSRSNFRASRRKFFTVWPLNCSARRSIEMAFCSNLRALGSKLASPFGQGLRDFARRSEQCSF